MKIEHLAIQATGETVVASFYAGNHLFSVTFNESEMEHFKCLLSVCARRQAREATSAAEALDE